MGSTLRDLKAFTGDFPPDMRGEMIGMQETIRDAHNSFSRQDPFVSDEKKKATEDDDVFHFIAYVPSGGKVWELDGLKAGPVVLGDVPGGDNSGRGWLRVAKERIESRIARYAASEIKFNLMAVVEDKRVQIRKDLAANPSDAAAGANLAAEEAKRAGWKEENERRQHNYIPFVMELIKALAGEGKLRGMMKEADERVKEKKKAGKSSKE